MHEEQAGHNRQQDEEEPGVRPEHQASRATHLAEGDECNEEIILDPVAHRLDVRNHATNKAPMAASVEERQWLGQ